jgi:hypothetical protein
LVELPNQVKQRTLITVLSVLILDFGLGQCPGQGTMTFTFEGEPRGFTTPVSAYTESSMQFWNPYGPENLVLNGGGISTRPESGTAYLQVSGNARLGFSFNTFPTTYFNLFSFDAAEYDTDVLHPVTLVVVGYKPMSGRVTNLFVLDGVNDGTGPLQDFQTFHLDSSFVNLYRVDILTDQFSLDNLVISGVPEPSSTTLIILAALSAAGWARVSRCRRSPPKAKRL